MKKLIIGACCALALAGTLPAFGNTFEPEPGFSSTNVNTGVPTGSTLNSYAASGTTLYNWQGNAASFSAGGGLFVGDFQGNNTPIAVNDPTDPNLSSYLSGAFNGVTTYHEATNTLWLGFTTSMNTDDRIYSVDLNTNTWSREGTNADVSGIYDIQFSGSDIYISALGSNGSGGNSIWHFDPTVNDSTALTEIVNPGGFSAGLTFDDGGNLYYGTSNGLPDGNVVYQFSASEVATALATDTPISIMDSQIITTVPGGVADVTVDDEDLLFFNFAVGSFPNQEYFLAQWNGVAGEAENYELLGEASAFLTQLEATGDFAEGDPVLALGGSTLFAVVPEPTSGALLGLALLGGLALRRSRRS